VIAWNRVQRKPLHHGDNVFAHADGAGFGGEIDLPSRQMLAFLLTEAEVQVAVDPLEGEPRGRDGDDPTRATLQELTKFAPAVHVHGRMAAELWRQIPGVDHRFDALRAVDAQVADDCFHAARRRAGERHDAEKQVTAWTRHTEELVEGMVGLIEDVAQRAAVANGGVEGAVGELTEVDYVRLDTTNDAGLQPGLRQCASVQFELACREVRDGDRGAEPSQFKSESAGSRADVENPVARPHEAAEVMGVDPETDRTRAPVFEAGPLPLAVLVEEFRHAL